MTFTKNQKVLLGVAHFLPLLGIIGYIICIFSMVFGTFEKIATNNGNPPPPEFFQGFFWAIILLIISIFISIGVKVIDVIHLVKNNKGDTGNKVVLWVLLFVFAGMLAEIVYYFMEILPEKRPETPQQNA